MTERPAVSVIIPARDAAATIAKTLEGLRRQRFDPAFEVIVVDDASSDDTAEVVRRSGLDAVLLQGDGSGAGHARNKAAALARAPALAFTDADCEPQAGWLESGVESLRSADIVQGSVVPNPNAPLRPFDRTVRVNSESGRFETANLFVRRDLFERLGGFEDWLIKPAGGASGASASSVPRPMGEDLLLGWRARRSGARTAFSRGAVVHHAVFPRGPLSFLREQTRLRYFPAIAKRLPEARESLFFARFFLSRRTAAFDAAAISVGATALAGSVWPLACILPYLWFAVSDAVRAGPKWAPIVFSVRGVADLIGLISLVWGSIRYRSLLL